MVKLALSVALAATALSTAVLAAPAPPANDVSFPSFQRDSVFDTYGQEGAAPTSFAPFKDDKDAATQYLAQQTGVKVSDLEITDDVEGPAGVRVIHFKKLINGKRVSTIMDIIEACALYLLDDLDYLGGQPSR